MPRRLFTLAFAIALQLPSFAFAEVGDPTLETDHPHYPGEGAFQTPASCVQWATKDAATDQEKALALFNWILTHQWHLASPQEWNKPEAIPGANPDDTEMMVYDANRGRFSYGYGLCGTVHAWNEPYWRALGLSARRRAFPGHTNSEVLLDGKWRVFDTDMAGLVFNQDGSVAGYDDVARDLTLLDRPASPWPRYPFAWPGDFEAMRAGWKKVAEGGHWYAMYGGGYAAQPGVVHLRKGETFTRHFHPDAFGDKTKRRFWHRQPGGPSRLWTFTNGGTPFHEGAQSNCRGNTTYGNAVFEYAPDLKTSDFLEGAVGRENVVESPEGLRGANAAEASVTFEHFSPYVICGDPMDDEDPLRHPATDGWVVTGTSSGKIRALVSSDQGQTWQNLPTQEGDLRWDATEHVKGRYGWRLKLVWDSGSVLHILKMSTTCQMSQAIYPRLRAGGTTVTYRTGGRAVVPVLPRLQGDSMAAPAFEDVSLRSANLDFVGRSARQSSAYRVRGPAPASVAFSIDSPTPLVGLSAAARYAIRSPSPPGSQFGLSCSADGGATWQSFGSIKLPEDNEFSSGWVDGHVDQWPAGTTSARVRVELNGGGAATGLIASELYGLRKTAAPGDVSITYAWSEGAENREYSFQVPAGQLEATSIVPTGADVRDRFVRIAVP